MAKMFKLDDNLLQELGLGALPPAEKNQMLNHIYMTLEGRVGVKLAEQMSPEQLDEFEKFIDTGVNGSDISYSTNFLNDNKAGWQTSEEYQTQHKSAQDAAARNNRPFNENAVISEFAALSWLEINFPTYKDVVSDQLEKLKGEIKLVAPQIMQASAAHAQQMQQQAAMQPRMAAPGQPMYAPAPQGYPAGYPAQPMAAPQGYYQQPMPQYAQPAPQGYYYQQAPMQPGYAQPMPQQAYRPVQQQPMPQQYPQAPAAPAPAAPAPQPQAPQSPPTPEPQAPTTPPAAPTN